MTNSNQPLTTEPPAKTTRRGLLKRAFWYGTAAAAAGVGYSAIEAGWLTLKQVRVAIPGLPPEWRGARIAQLTDIHHGPFTGLDYIANAVKLTNEQQPDVVLLTGDFSHRHPKYVLPCFRKLAELQAPLGVFTIPGNHEYYEGIAHYYDGVDYAEFRDLTNRSTILRRNGAPLGLAGIDDYLVGQPNLDRAMSPLPVELPTLLLCHNADGILEQNDSRVKLILSGHTHGGQVNFPFYGPPYLGGYRAPYIAGLYQTPRAAQIYVSRGIGTITPPLRFNAPPELTILELDVA